MEGETTHPPTLLFLLLFFFLGVGGELMEGSESY